jgi:hypothetical protein
MEVSSNEPRSNDGSVIACNAATAMALQHVTLLLLRRYDAVVAATRARNDGVVATLAAALLFLLLELAALLQL